MPIEPVLDLHPPAADLRADVLEGLSAPVKKLPPKWLYDELGSELFDRICETADYYPTRTERGIYEQHGAEIAETLGAGVALIEPGAGSGEKAERLLRALDAPAAFIPVEISRSALEGCADRVHAALPELDVLPVCADFTGEMPRGAEIRRSSNVVVFFPGSTIGNFDPVEARALLERFADLAGPGGRVLIGVDLMKGEDVLRAAYDDSDGLTEAFNRNILDRINRELDGGFDQGGFEHEARVNGELRRVEMHLVSRAAQEVRVGDARFAFGAGESIHTESSHKFDPQGFAQIAKGVGLVEEATWTDERGWFAVMLLRTTA